METEVSVVENENLDQEEIRIASHHLSSIIPIVLFSYIGVLIRLGLNLLGNDQSPLSATLWSNVIGCFVMGFVFEQKSHLQHEYVH